MIELTIGSRFYYKDKLCEVVKGVCYLNNCVFTNTNKCKKIKCGSYQRHDKTQVCFEEVKE